MVFRDILGRDFKPPKAESKSLLPLESIESPLWLSRLRMFLLLYFIKKKKAIWEQSWISHIWLRSSPAVTRITTSIFMRSLTKGSPRKNLPIPATLGVQQLCYFTQAWTHFHSNKQNLLEGSKTLGAYADPVIAENISLGGSQLTSHISSREAWISSAIWAPTSTTTLCTTCG